MPNCEDIVLSKNTRRSKTSARESSICNCYICLTGKNELATKILVSYGFYSSQNSKVPTLPKIDNNYLIFEKVDAIKLCKVYMTELYKGKTHICSTRNQDARKKLVNNLDNE